MRNEQIQETNLSGWVGGDKEGGMRIALTVWCPRWYLCTVCRMHNMHITSYELVEYTWCIYVL